MIKKLMLIITSLMLLHSGVNARAPKHSTARTFTAVVTHVTDGDTIWISTGRGTQAIDVRIQGVDAPESCQEYGRIATSALHQYVLHKTVSVTGRARDKYGRMVAKVTLNGEDVGAWLVEHGHAWSYHSRRSLGAYGQQEVSARLSRRGLWANDSPLEPKLFRKQTKCHK